MPENPRIFISSGELSGDFHASHLIKEIRRKCPSATFVGIGSHNMKKAGVELLYDSSSWGGIGLWNNIRCVYHVNRKRLEIAKKIAEINPDLLIVIDFRVFHTSLLKMIQHLDFPKLYYVAPVVWPGFSTKGIGKAYADFLARSRSKNTLNRFEALAKFTDKQIVAYPFALQNYLDAGADAVFLGHPLMNVVKASKTKSEVFSELGIESGTKLIGIFPGSRRHELKAHLPVLREVIKQLREKIGEVKFYIPVAHPDYKELITRLLGKYSEGIKFIEGDDYDIFAASDLAISKTGTSVQVMMALGVPTVAFYTVVSSFWYNLTIRYMAQFDYIAFPNVLAGRLIIPEYYQDTFTPENIINSAIEILSDDEKCARMRDELLAIRAELYRPDAIEKAADIALDLIDRHKKKIADERN